MDADLLIVGGGPAGLATAIRAALEGLDSLVVEPRDGVIDKACGEGLMPPAVRALQQMGVALPGGRSFRGIRYIQGEVEVEAAFPWGTGLGVRRTMLHQVMRRRAEELGVRFALGRVTSFEQRADRVVAMVRPGRVPGATPVPFSASWMVGADGLHSPTRRYLSLGLPPLHPPRFGLRRHFTAAPWTDCVEVHWGPSVEAYVTPVSESCVGVALIFEGRGEFEEGLACFPGLQRRLGPPCTHLMGAGPFEQRVRSRVAGRVLLVGDAAGFVDPLTGEGVRLGLEGARLLVRCLASGRPADYEAAWLRMSRAYRVLTHLLRAAQRLPALRARLVRLLRVAPCLFRAGLATLCSPGQHSRGPMLTPRSHP